MENTNRNLMILEAEKEQVEMKLKSQIMSIRNMLDNIESKLENKQQLYVSDGLQGNGGNIDIYVSQIATYIRAIEIFKREMKID